MKLDLKKNIVLLTGATGGIGKSVANLLSNAGATIAIHFNKNKNKAAQIQKDIKNNSAVFKADLGDPHQVESLFKQVISTYGKIDTLINNAGIYLSSPLSKNTESWLHDWEKTLSINLTSAALLCKLSIPVFIENGGGRIINIASRAAFRGDAEEYFAYAASKGGLVSLTKTVAKNFGNKNIKAFVVAPGFVNTPMAKEFIDKYGKEKIINELSLPKITGSDDVSPTILFLASGMMDHSTGNTIDINAGSYLR